MPQSANVPTRQSAKAPTRQHAKALKKLTHD